MDLTFVILQNEIKCIYKFKGILTFMTNQTAFWGWIKHRLFGGYTFSFLWKNELKNFAHDSSNNSNPLSVLLHNLYCLLVYVIHCFLFSLFAIGRKRESSEQRQHDELCCKIAKNVKENTRTVTSVKCFVTTTVQFCVWYTIPTSCQPF